MPATSEMGVVAVLKVKLEDVVKKNVDASNRRKFNTMQSLRAPEVVSHTPLFPRPLKGKSGARKIQDIFDRAFPDLKVKMYNVMAKGNTVAAEQILIGTNTGPLEGPNGTLPPTNRRIRIHLGIFWRFNARGQIVEQHSYWDTATMMRQLGHTWA